jgi:hypothetical protein
MDRVEWRNVFSTVVAQVGYNHDKDLLLIQWLNSVRISVYGPQFPYELFDKLSKAPSVGSMLRTEIRPKFEHTYLE